MQYVPYLNEPQCACPVKLELVAIGYSFGTYLKLSSESTVRAIVSCYVIELCTSGSLYVGCVTICRVKEEIGESRVFQKNSAVAAAVYVEIQGMDHSPS